MGKSLMDFCDDLTAKFLLPLGGLLTCLFVGWYVTRQVVHDEFTNYGRVNHHHLNFFLFTVRYISPIFIAMLFLHQMGVL